MPGYFLPGGKMTLPIDNIKFTFTSPGQSDFVKFSATNDKKPGTQSKKPFPGFQKALHTALLCQTVALTQAFCNRHFLTDGHLFNLRDFWTGRFGGQNKTNFPFLQGRSARHARQSERR